MPLRPDLIDQLQAGRQEPDAETIARRGWSSADALADSIARQAIDNYDQTSAGQDRLYNPDIIPSNLSPEAKALCESLDLVKEYHTQVEVLTEARLLTSEGNITAIDGKAYPIPTIEQIAHRVEANVETYRTKLEQGFRQLLLVPFGMSLTDIITSYGDRLEAVSSADGLVDSKGEPQTLDDTTPVWVWDELVNSELSGTMVYYPEYFSREPSAHGGKTKAELIDSGNAWEVMLVEAMTDIPAPGADTTTAGRAQLEAGTSPHDYLARLGTEPAYAAESGLTVEAWLSLALTRLSSKQQVLDSWQSAGKINYLLGSYLPTSDSVATAHWGRGNARADLNMNWVGGIDDVCGLRAAVRVV